MSCAYSAAAWSPNARTVSAGGYIVISTSFSWNTSPSVRLCLAAAIDFHATLPPPADPCPLSSLPPPHSPPFPRLLWHNTLLLSNAVLSAFFHLHNLFLYFFPLSNSLSYPSLSFLLSSTPVKDCPAPASALIHCLLIHILNTMFFLLFPLFLVITFHKVKLWFIEVNNFWKSWGSTVLLCSTFSLKLNVVPVQVCTLCQILTNAKKTLWQEQ